MNAGTAFSPKEVTLRGVLLGIAITLVFTAAQVYLGLKVGLTFATSIPAAVISMALLRAFKTATIQENNIVQTIASAAGTLASVIFVLPGLIMIGWWANVPFWPTFFACAVGGVLGVMYTMPLRRALVSNSTLPYPEGVAAAEVLKVGMNSREGGEEGKAGLFAVIWGSILSAGYAALAGTKLMAAEVAGFFKYKGASTGLVGTSSLALMGAGHLMGITVGIAMLTGLIIAWGIAVPALTYFTPMPDVDAAKHATTVWRTQVRMMGAGTIGVAALWTLGTIALPVWRGLMSALEAARARKAGNGEGLPRSEQDLPVWLVGLVTLLMLVPAGWILAEFLKGGPLESLGPVLIGAGVAYVLFAGLLAAGVCGYMAGLIGSSNSPVSGIAILTVLGASLTVGFLANSLSGMEAKQALVAYALFVTTVVLAVAVIGNDNLQDLKTGQLVDATPWKQQIALIIGVIAGSVMVPLILNLLNESNGFAGDPNYHAITNDPLPAPQATLISTLAKGVIGGELDWLLLGYGALIGLGLIAFNEVLKALSKGKLSLPPLGVGLAIYLPSAVTAPVVLGAFAGWIFHKIIKKKASGEIADRLGVLVASGFIVGESLFNVTLALLITLSGKPEPLSLGVEIPEHTGMLIAVVVAAVIVIGLYSWAIRAAKKVHER